MDKNRMLLSKTLCLFYLLCFNIMAGCNLNQVKPASTPLPKELTRFNIQTVNDIAWSPNGSIFAVAFSEVDTNGIALYDAETLKELWLGDAGRVNSIAFSPDGKFLAISSNSGHINLLDTSSGKVVSDYYDNNCYFNDGIAYTPDGESLLTSHTSKLITIFYLWNTSSGTCMGEFARYEGWLHNFKISPDGNFIVASLRKISEEDSFRVLLWDLRTGKIVCQLKGKIAYFSLDGNLVIPNIDDETQLDFWNVTNCQLSQQVNGIKYLGDLVFTPDGKFMITATDRIQLWKLPNWESIYESNGLPNSPQWVKKLNISPNGHYLLTLIPKTDYLQDDALLLWKLSP